MLNESFQSKGVSNNKKYIDAKREMGNQTKNNNIDWKWYEEKTRGIFLERKFFEEKENNKGKIKSFSERGFFHRKKQKRRVEREQDDQLKELYLWSQNLQVTHPYLPSSYKHTQICNIFYFSGHFVVSKL